MTLLEPKLLITLAFNWFDDDIAHIKVDNIFFNYLRLHTNNIKVQIIQKIQLGLSIDQLSIIKMKSQFKAFLKLIEETSRTENRIDSLNE